VLDFVNFSSKKENGETSAVLKWQPSCENLQWNLLLHSAGIWDWASFSGCSYRSVFSAATWMLLSSEDLSKACFWAACEESELSAWKCVVTGLMVPSDRCS